MAGWSGLLGSAKVAGGLAHAAAAVASGAFSVTTGLLAASMITYSGYVLYDTAYVEHQAYAASVDLMAYRPTIIEDEAVPLTGASLSSINEDYRAWLVMDDTKIDYPVMQGPNDLYYVSHDVYRNSSLSGAIYFAAANSSDLSDSYNLVYGHHMDNGAMFGGLDAYCDANYLSAHRTGTLVAGEDVYDLQAFAVAKTDAYEWTLYDAGNRMDEVLSFLRNPTEKTETLLFDEAVLGNARQIIAFSTCASADTNGRLMVFATMTPRDTPLYLVHTDGSGRGPTTNPPSVTPKNTAKTFPDDGETLPNGSPPVDGGGTLPDGTPVDGGGTLPDGTPVDGGGTLPDGTPVDGGGTLPDDTPIDGGGTLPDDTPVDGGGTLSDGTPIDDDEPLIDIQDLLTPLSGWANQFQPAGSSYNGRAWALINLVALAYTLYLLFPLTHAKAKFFRAGTMKKINRAKEALFDAEDLNERELLEKTMIEREAVKDKAREDGADVEEALREAEAASFADVTEDEFTAAADKLYYQVKQFLRRFRVGVCAELVVAALAALAFLWTEDMRLPMALIDKWTPLMLIFLTLCWVIDIRLARYRGDRLWEDQRRRDEAEKALAQ